MPEVELDEVNHRAYLLENGTKREVTRMTSALASVGIVDTRGFTEESRDRGRWIHDAMLTDFRGGLVYAGEQTAPFWDGYLAFKRETRFVPYACEGIVSDVDAGYAGQFDLFGRLPDLPVSAADLLDLKSGSAPAWVAIQTMGYKRCLPIMAGLPARIRRWALELPGNHRYRLIPLNMTEGLRIDPRLDDYHERIALGAVAIANWKMAHA